MQISSLVVDELERLGLGAIRSRTAVGGGDISVALRLECEHGAAFLKTGPASSDDIFSAEADGLNELQKADCLRVPTVLAKGADEQSAFILMEWLALESADRRTDAKLGERLAMLHRRTAASHGWHRDTMIGLMPQPNPEMSDWAGFFKTQRIEFQLALADSHGYQGELQALGQQLAARLPDTLDHRPEPSLLHGDLWSGNRASIAGEPVVFDPAVYYGDRETDIAMTKLFGGFSSTFYESYNEVWALPDGWERRVELYKLYHVLNHLNLFGGGYLTQAEAMLRGLLR